MPPATVIDLSAEGGIDWAHWGLNVTNSFNHKSGVTSQITNASLIGDGSFEFYATNQNGFSWSNGTPVLKVTNTPTAFSVTGLNNGFQLVIPAGTNEMRLRLYVGVAAAAGTLQASLSDQSSPDITDTSLDSAGESLSGSYTVRFAAASPGQLLTLQFTATTSYDPAAGKVTLQAASLATNSSPTVGITSPTNNAIFFVTQDIPLAALAADTDGSVSNVEFFQGATSLGSVSTAPYTLTWSSPVAGDYTLTARATDNEGAVTVSSPIIIHVNSNTPPSVTLSNPIGDSQFLVPATISISANASDTNGTVTKVEFYRGSTKLGEVTNSPFTFNWTNATPGVYDLTAKATDNLGASTISKPVTIFVYTTGGLLSGSGSVVPQGSVVNLTTEGIADWAHWGRFTETSFDHKAGVTSKIGNYSLIGGQAPYSYSDNYNGYDWTDGTPTRSATNTTTGIYCVGLGNGFQVIAPADKNTNTLKLYVGTYGAKGKLVAYLSDLTAPIYIDSSLDNPGNGPGLVYTLNYAAAANGKSLIAKFTTAQMHDSGSGNVTLQAATLVTGNNPPSAAITNPINNSVFLAPTNILLQATATDSDGSVTNLEFFDGTNKLTQLINPPYNFTWTNPPLGLHHLIAKATDNRADSYTTFPVDLFVTVGGGTLAGNFALPPRRVDLSTEGRTDWAHWGLNALNSYDHRRQVPQRIGNFSTIGNVLPKRYSDNFTAFSWTNGTPTLAATDSSTGLYITGITNGFQISVPADTIQRRLKLYAGLYGAQGKLEASLSDSSAPSYVDSSILSVYNNAYGVYTIDFAAASTNQTLVIRYTSAAIFDSTYGNVTLQAATLALPGYYLRNFKMDSNNFQFSFFSEPITPYTVWYSDPLDPANWLTLSNVIGNGGELFFTNNAPLPATRYYRVTSP